MYSGIRRAYRVGGYFQNGFCLGRFVCNLRLQLFDESFKSKSIKPLMPIFRVIAPAHFKLLKKADHPIHAQLFFQGV